MNIKGLGLEETAAFLLEGLGTPDEDSLGKVLKSLRYDVSDLFEEESPKRRITRIFCSTWLKDGDARIPWVAGYVNVEMTSGFEFDQTFIFRVGEETRWSQYDQQGFASDLKPKRIDMFRDPDGSVRLEWWTEPKKGAFA